MSDDDDGVVVCYGDAAPSDVHLLARIVAVDGEIVGWLAKRERRANKHEPCANVREHRIGLCLKSAAGVAGGIAAPALTCALTMMVQQQ